MFKPKRLAKEGTELAPDCGSFILQLQYWTDEKRSDFLNESIGRNHLCEKPIFRQSGKLPHCQSSALIVFELGKGGRLTGAAPSISAKVRIRAAVFVCG